MRRRWNGYRGLRRAAAGTAGLLLVGVLATPAWADPPVAPSIVSVTPGNAQIVVAYSSTDPSITSFGADCESTDPGASPGTGTGAATDTSIRVTGVTKGDTYTCTVTSNNTEGSAPSTPSDPVLVPTTKPDPPSITSVTSGAGQIIVAYTAGDDGGDAITRFDASCTSADPDADSGTGTGAATDTSITVTGVTNGSSYQCTVTATNGVATSDPSALSGPVTPASVPDAPPKPTVASANAALVVSFGAANDGGSVILDYTASCNPTGGGSGASNTASGSPITVSGLVNGTTYTCVVTARNALGSGGFSPASDNAIPSTVPGPPTVTGVTRGNASVSVAFTAGATNGSPITSFTASCMSSNGGAPGTKIGASSPLVVPLLTNGKSYTCKVTEKNAKGTSAPSAASAVVIPATVPHAPTIGVADSGDASASVSFTPGANNGSPITSYSATCTSTNGGATGTHTGTTSPITVSGLTNGNIYSCTAKAINSVGPSAASAASKAFVEGQPDAPTGARVVPGSAPGTTGPLQVQFTPGSSNGSAITSYEAACDSTNGGADGSKSGIHSPITVIGLTTGKTYLCTVVATNARGTSFPSGGARGTVGAPAAPIILRALPINHGLVLPFAIPANNGSVIINYRARCTSSDGGVSSSPLQVVSPIVSTNLTNGKTYTCSVTANNHRGEGAATAIAPIVVGAPNLSSLATCSGNTGTFTASHGLLLTVSKSQTFTLATTLSTCNGPYVSAARLAFTVQASRAISCANAINVTSGGSGTLTWTSPQGMGKSSATVQFVITSSSGHVTKVHYSGTVTSRGNVFTGNHVSGNLTLNRGLQAAAAGGDCTASHALTGFGVTAASLTIS